MVAKGEEEGAEGDKKEDLIVKEEKSAGSIGCSAYSSFFGLSCGWGLNLFIVLFTAATPFMQGYLRYFITNWVSLPFSQQQEAHYSWLYSAVSLACIGIATTASIAFVLTLLYVSNKLHNKMLEHVTRAPILFFDSNPLGRVINRFSKDASVVDGALPIQMIVFVNVFWDCVMLTVMTLSVYPYLGFLVVVLLGLMLLIRKISLTSTMDCLRIDAITRSPINSMFSASLNGLMTIRAYQKEDHFQRQFLSLVDRNGRAYFTYSTVSEWMAYYLDFVSGFFILATVLMAFLLKSQANDPAYVALGITSALSLSGPFQFLVTSTANLANSMTSVQRMQEYADLKSEPPQVLPTDKELKGSWPSKGELLFDDVVMRYREGFDPVLKHVSFKVAPGMKVGVVGRTGAGKSSLLQALFRLTDVEPSSKILIDNVDTANVGLKMLRESISIIPQSPFIFEGTVRENLDPFSLYSDQAIWDSLEDVQLKQSVE